MIRQDFCFGFVFLSNMDNTCSLTVRCEEQRHTGDLPRVIQLWSCILKNDNLLLDIFFLSSFESKLDLPVSCNDGFGLE